MDCTVDYAGDGWNVCASKVAHLLAAKSHSKIILEPFLLKVIKYGIFLGTPNNGTPFL